MPRFVYSSTSCLVGEPESLRKRIGRYVDAGIDNIELGARVIDNVDISSLTEEFPTQRFLVHNYFPPPQEPFVLNIASGDPDIRQKSIDLVRNALDLSFDLGAPFYSLHGGFIVDPVGFDGQSFIFPDPDSSDAEHRAFDRFVSAVESLLCHSADTGVRLLIENNVCTTQHLGKLLFTGYKDFLALFEVSSGTSLGILLDTGHLNIAAHTLRSNRFECINFLSPYISAFHLHDNNGLLDQHRLPDEGSWVWSVLNRPEFAGLPVICEAEFSSLDELRVFCSFVTTQ
jgi:sugar phosphate isomerase/epimerase